MSAPEKRTSSGLLRLFAEEIPKAEVSDRPPTLRPPPFDVDEFVNLEHLVDMEEW